MQSQLLAEFLRTGFIPPLAKGDLPWQVESKLGQPDDWIGRIRCFSWPSPPLADFQESDAWHYGSLCVSFSVSTPQSEYPEISLCYLEIPKPIRFPAPFSELPASIFTVRELITFLRDHDISFDDYRGEPSPFMITEGGVAAYAAHADCSLNSKVIYLNNGQKFKGI